MRRHANIQKGVEQNGMGHDNIHKDEFAWRRGIMNTIDMQQNVKQDGIGKRNNESLRRINELMRYLFIDRSDKKRIGTNRLRHPWNQQFNPSKDAMPSRRNGNLKQNERVRNKNRNEQLESACRTLQEQVDFLKAMLCKTTETFCDPNDKFKELSVNDTTHAKHIHKSDEKSGVESASKFNRLRPSFLDKQDEIIYLPNYEIVLK